ncbi:hypothetical protein CLAIMM_15176 [Cladophialophora immunda]|nr:hypothetical protein CLAIMM_15176 [Cladophialophora immunda]
MPLDALSITVACATLIANIGKLSKDIYSFVSRIRDAHRDLDSVLKELSSLGLCLEALRGDAMVRSNRVPNPLEQRVLLVLANTAEVVKEINELLDDLSSNKFGNKMRWATYGHGNMNKLRSRLESHKASLEIVLALLNLSLSTAIKEDTDSIRRNVKDNALTLEQINEALALLPERLAAQWQTGTFERTPTTSERKPPNLSLPPAEAPVSKSERTLSGLFPPTVPPTAFSVNRMSLDASDIWSRVAHVSHSDEDEDKWVESGPKRKSSKPHGRLQAEEDEALRDLLIPPLPPPVR